MKDSHKAALIAILITIVIGLIGMVIGSFVVDFYKNDTVIEKNITVIGKICGDKIMDTNVSNIQDSDLVVYGTTFEECIKYKIGSNYTIRYNNIKSGLSGVNYNLLVGV